MARIYRTIPWTPERLRSRCYLTEAGCWEWKGMLNEGGYGVIKFNRRGSPEQAVGAHRMAYSLFRGDIGDLDVLHRCDRRSCCNPDHLFLGTQADNNRDMFRKGRWKTRHGNRGDNAPMAKLSERQALEIRALYRTGLFRHKDLAARYDVTPSLISMIMTRKVWSHI